ncbi:MAG: hypothetical protein AAGF97_09770 [Planctomycetota bacterium]
MFRKTIAAIAVLGLLAATPYVFGAFNADGASEPCACCGEGCTCTDCACDELNCACSDGGECCCTDCDATCCED